MINFYKTHSKKIEILLIFSANYYIISIKFDKNIFKIRLTSEYQILSLAFDSIFLIDFIFKLFIYRSKYFKGPLVYRFYCSFTHNCIIWLFYNI